MGFLQVLLTIVVVNLVQFSVFIVQQRQWYSTFQDRQECYHLFVKRFPTQTIVQHFIR